MTNELGQSSMKFVAPSAQASLLEQSKPSSGSVPRAVGEAGASLLARNKASANQALFSRFSETWYQARSTWTWGLCAEYNLLHVEYWVLGTECVAPGSTGRDSSSPRSINCRQFEA